MVRNNWYDINISSIKNLGSPVVPDANVETPDDSKDKDEWIAFVINTMSWAKRVTNYDL